MSEPPTIMSPTFKFPLMTTLPLSSTVTPLMVMPGVETVVGCSLVIVSNAHGNPLQPDGSLAFSRCLREKGLNLPLHFSAVAAGALTPFFVVLADCHCESET